MVGFGPGIRGVCLGHRRGIYTPPQLKEVCGLWVCPCVDATVLHCPSWQLLTGPIMAYRHSGKTIIAMERDIICVNPLRAELLFDMHF